jgi:5-methylcytosine-specific restriction enzyme A
VPVGGYRYNKFCMKRISSKPPALQPVAVQPEARACKLCERSVSGISKHHLVPKAEGGIATVDLCATCHATLHRFFTNRTLAREFNTIEALRRAPEVRRYLAWVRKQPDRPIRVRRSRVRR